jgi:hypothetical protein
MIYEIDSKSNKTIFDILKKICLSTSKINQFKIAPSKANKSDTQKYKQPLFYISTHTLNCSI